MHTTFPSRPVQRRHEPFCCCPSNLIWPRVFSLLSAPRCSRDQLSSVTWRESKECGAVPDWKVAHASRHGYWPAPQRCDSFMEMSSCSTRPFFCFLFPNSKPLHDPIDTTLCQLFPPVAGAGAGDLIKWALDMLPAKRCYSTVTV